MSRTITYYLALISPFTYLGHDRLRTMAKAQGAAIDYRPIDIMAVFKETGAVPPVQRHPNVQAYRGAELRRWSARLGLPLTAKPRFFPVPLGLASGLVMAVGDTGADAGAVAGACLRAVWAEDRDISDAATLAAIATEQGLDATAMMAAAAAPAMADRLAANTRQALDAGVFGSPTYCLGNEIFWGQDRLNMLEDALAAR